MDERDWLAQRFEAHRTRLRAVAYRMLGAASEADDAVQEAWIRLSRTDTGAVENLGGWLTTVVARVSLDMLRSRASRREQPLGAHPPEAELGTANGTDPEAEALLADSVGPALLVVLETLAPAERLAFVLHDMFAVPFDEIAPILGRSPNAAKQLASPRRARPGRRAPCRPRRRAPGRRGRAARRGGHGGHVLREGPRRSTGADQRDGRRRLVTRRESEGRVRLHHRARPGRAHRHDRRPRHPRRPRSRAARMTIGVPMTRRGR